MDILSTDINMTRWLVASLVMALLLTGFAYVLKRWANHGPLTPKGKRMRVVESLHIDSRHKAVILTQDAVEHVVLIGPQGTTHLLSQEAATNNESSDTPEHPHLAPRGIGFLKNILGERGAKPSTTPQKTSSKG